MDKQEAQARLAGFVFCFLAKGEPQVWLSPILELPIHSGELSYPH